MFVYQTQLYQNYLKIGDAVRTGAGKMVLHIFPAISPNQITLTSFSVGVAALWLTAQGYWLYGAAAYYLSDVLDGIDGYIARKTNKHSPFGAYLDSTLDRYVDVLMIVAAVFSLIQHGGWPAYWVLIMGLAILGVFMPSYTTHRAESLEKVALQFPLPFTRRTRMHLLILGLLAGKPEYVVVLFAIIGNLNIAWRLWPQHLTSFTSLSKPEKESLPKTTIRKYS
ncbi:MAG: CDP-alcohol phosphatidyltransferase family protein [Candidatus Roizmanbacteria bacterium]|nr:CDP-alcohol phosphatidyltransferase family protein [Candidatus Roizmanbacteria bacterium]